MMLPRRLPSVLSALTSLTLAACLSAPLTPIRLPGRASSGMVALSADGARLAVVNPDAGSLTLLDAQSLQVLAELPVGAQPRTVAFTPDGAEAWVASQGADRLDVVAVASARWVAQVPIAGQPYGVVADAQRLYVSQFALGQVAVVDRATRQLIRTIPVEPFPAGLALADGQLYITHLYSGHITRLDLSTLAPEGVIVTDPEANLSQSLALSPDGRRAYLPQTLSHAANLRLSVETTVSPVVNVLDLNAAQARPAERLTLYLNGQVANLPYAAAVSPDGRWLFVANAGTDDVWMMALNTGQLAARFPVGHNPRGLAVSPDGRRLFVAAALDGALDVVTIDYQEGGSTPMPRMSHLTQVPLTSVTLPATLRLGQQLFNSARPPMSTGWLSCATCHLDGGQDARTWLGFPDGPRNTPALGGVAATAPYHWSGDLPELQSVEFTIRAIQHGAGLITGTPNPAAGPSNAGRSAQLDALAAYLASLKLPPSPTPLDAEAVRRGAKAFERWGCAGCHAAPLFTDRQSHTLPNDGIGLQAQERGPRGLAFDTPALAGVWATAPYFHDGSAATLRDTLFRAGFHGMGRAMNQPELDDLLAYLNALPLPVADAAP